MSELNKIKVYQGYDQIIDWYDDARAKSLMEFAFNMIQCQ